MEKINKNQDVLKIMEFLFNEFFKKHEGLIELRFISKKTGIPISKFYNLGEINDDVIKEIQTLNINHHVFLGVNPRPLSKRKKQDDIRNIVCLWVDLDGKDFKNGKDDALKSINNFLPKPNIIVDSGNGYHFYWLFKEPIININDEIKLEFKKILSGIISELNADKHAINLDRVMRLPGTYNIKKDEPLECKIVGINPDERYSLIDFEQFKDNTYQESQLDINNMPDFGELELLVSTSSPNEAHADISTLEIQPIYKKLIVTGALKAYQTTFKSRSERDFAVINALISASYNYSTSKSIFFNQHLGCSERIREKGEDKLKWDVYKALEFEKLRKPHLTPE